MKLLDRPKPTNDDEAMKMLEEKRAAERAEAEAYQTEKNRLLGEVATDAGVVRPDDALRVEDKAHEITGEHPVVSIEVAEHTESAEEPVEVKQIQG